ncbi:hypothetical protein ACJMK2_012184 [Sinanodonta woodiana]|uniref:Uncharacterized protein n=1 Tax=Sinanodonta woodiana TaxID=1069815 RepID=A0ABD3V7F0_SINWO
MSGHNKFIHKALIPEIFCSTCLDQGDSNESYQDRPQTIPLFPLLICHYRQNKTSHIQLLLDNMSYVIEHEDLQFTDTTLNLVLLSEAGSDIDQLLQSSEKIHESPQCCQMANS